MAEDINTIGNLFSQETGKLRGLDLISGRALAEAAVSARVKYDHLNDPNKFKINGEDYYCYFEISKEETPTDDIHPTKVDPTNKIRLTKSAIVNLDIQENLFEPFCSGSITINNPFDYLEDNHYTTGNGDDYLHMELCNWKERLIDPNLSLKYTFVITDESNSVSKSDRSNNFKTYRLLDKNYARLNEQIPYGKTYPTNAMIETGDISVGACIKQVLIDALGPDVIGPQWHNGSHNIGEPNGQFPALQEYISSPLNWRYSDLLKYLLQINYSLGGEGQTLPVQCILYFDRTIQKYSLDPIDAIFKDNGALTIEAFGLGDLTGNIDEQTQASGKDGERWGTNKNNPKDSKIPVNVNEGMLKNTNVTTPMISYGDEFFVDYSTGFYDQQTGAGGQIQTSLEDIVPEWQQAFVDVFKLVGGTPQPFVPYNKIRGKTVKTMVCPFEKDQIQNIAKAQMVSNLTFLNLQLTIDNPGGTNRQPGTFIDLFKLIGPKDTESFSDGKVLGRWFVTKVHHRFFKDSYENVMQCVKTYVGPGNPESEIPPPGSGASGLGGVMIGGGEDTGVLGAGLVQVPRGPSGSSRRATGQYRATAYGNVLGDDGRPLDNTTRDDIAKGDMQESWQYLGNRNNRLIPGYSVASNNFPHGTRLRINGREYRVDDTGGMDPNANIIDFYAGGDRALYGQLANMTINSVEVIN